MWNRIPRPRFCYPPSKTTVIFTSETFRPDSCWMKFKVAEISKYDCFIILYWLDAWPKVFQSRLFKASATIMQASGVYQVSFTAVLASIRNFPKSQNLGLMLRTSVCSIFTWQQQQQPTTTNNNQQQPTTTNNNQQQQQPQQQQQQQQQQQKFNVYNLWCMTHSRAADALKCCNSMHDLLHIYI